VVKKHQNREVTVKLKDFPLKSWQFLWTKYWEFLSYLTYNSLPDAPASFY